MSDLYQILRRYAFIAFFPVVDFPLPQPNECKYKLSPLFTNLSILSRISFKYKNSEASVPSSSALNLISFLSTSFNNVKLNNSSNLNFFEQNSLSQSM